MADGRFRTTRWNLVEAAGHADSTRGREALDDLCRVYWPPLYGFVRHRGYSPEDAQDLTQEFFVRLIARHDLCRADAAKGRFRSFLLVSMQHFLANEWDHAHRMKRGGGAVALSIDANEAEASYASESPDRRTPERLFERRWALSLLNRVVHDLRADYVSRGNVALFDELKGTLSGELSSMTDAAVGARLQLSVGAVKIAAHRLRARYRQRLRAEVARTVVNADEVDDELRFLLAALAP
jgi:RNA polymerase sigma-70 factor (ECF subfamily)